MLCFVDFFIWMRVLGYKKILAVRDVVYEKNPEDSNDSKIEKWENDKTHTANKESN